MEKAKVRDLQEGDFFRFESNAEVFEVISLPTDHPIAWYARIGASAANWCYNVEVEKVDRPQSQEAAH